MCEDVDPDLDSLRWADLAELNNGTYEIAQALAVWDRERRDRPAGSPCVGTFLEALSDQGFEVVATVPIPFPLEPAID